MGEIVELREIFENPSEWMGREVILEVEYLGWGAEGCDLLKSSMRTRSDVTLRQGEYCIFCDPIPGLRPAERVKIKLRATVEIFLGKPRLREPQLLGKIE